MQRKPHRRRNLPHPPRRLLRVRLALAAALLCAAFLTFASCSGQQLFWVPRGKVVFLPM